MDKDQLRTLITKTLEWLAPFIPFRDDAVELLMLTAAQETSLGCYIEQVGGGPALGIFQMEPKTEQDIWDNYLKYRQGLKNKISVLIIPESPVPNLQCNLVYQIVMTRIHYYRCPERLPEKGDVLGMATYYKKYYNTEKGKATIADAVYKYKRLCLQSFWSK